LLESLHELLVIAICHVRRIDSRDKVAEVDNLANVSGVLRVVVGGPVGGGDNWSIGLNMGVGTPAADAGATGTEMNTVATDVLAFVKTAWDNANGIKTICRSGTALLSASSYLYGTGAVLTAQGAATIASDPGTGSFPAPAFNALVVSLQTATAGRSGRGRLYLPASSPVSNASDGQSTITATLGPVIRTLLQALTRTYVLHGANVVGSLVVASPLTDNYDFATSFHINSLYDTQRGRQNRLTANATYSNTI
jgi:hypothetical protein